MPGVESSTATPTGARSPRGRTRLLEISPGDEAACLLLRAHLPYWEGLIHVVDRVGRC